MIQFLMTKNPKGAWGKQRKQPYFAPEDMLLGEVTGTDFSQTWVNAIHSAVTAAAGTAGFEAEVVPNEYSEPENGASGDEDGPSAQQMPDAKAVTIAVAEQLGWIVAVLDLAANGFVRFGGVNPAQGILFGDGRIPHMGVPLLQYALNAPLTCRKVWHDEHSASRKAYKRNFDAYTKATVEPLFRSVYG